MRHKTIIDVATSEDAVDLLQKVSSRDDDTGSIAEKLVRIFTAFPPSEMNMRALSLLQQRFACTGGIEEFATSTVYAAATIAVAEAPVKKKVL